jgi:galactokinase
MIEGERRASLMEELDSLGKAGGEGLVETEKVRLFSCPGRTELSGNHTDHNGGRVLAAAVDLDALAAAVPRTGGIIEVRSRGFPRPFRVNISDTVPRAEERGKTEALIRGVAAGFLESGRKAGGFLAAVDSRVPPGSGLSSSAAFEVLIGTIMNGLYNRGALGYDEIARIGQRAENEYFGKPCGLMDQIACAAGGIVSIDFGPETGPRVERLHFDFDAAGYALYIMNTGGSHADLTEDYAAVPREMKAVARALGREDLGGLALGDLLPKLSALRSGPGDRALLRSLHFFAENDRVGRQFDALKKGEIGDYLSLVRESGRSSLALVQNGYAPSAPAEQGIPLGIALGELFLRGDGACRVHGGGFAGTVQAYVPEKRSAEFMEFIEPFFGPAAAVRIRIRGEGAREISPV